MKPKIDQWFWDVIESSAASLRLLCRKLEKMPKEKVVRYQRHFEEAKSLVNPLYREDFASYVDDDSSCSDDEADDFAAWVVMQGKHFFENVVNDPAQLFAGLKKFQESEEEEGAFGVAWDENVDSAEYKGYQRADYVAVPIFRARFGEELSDVV